MWQLSSFTPFFSAHRSDLQAPGARHRRHPADSYRDLVKHGHLLFNSCRLCRAPLRAHPRQHTAVLTVLFKRGQEEVYCLSTHSRPREETMAKEPSPREYLRPLLTPSALSESSLACGDPAFLPHGLLRQTVTWQGKVGQTESMGNNHTTGWGGGVDLFFPHHLQSL